MAQQSTGWFHTLPLVLLGIRTAFREDLDCSSAELVYGTTLRLPGEFYESPTGTSPDSSNYMRFLRSTMHQIRPSVPRAGKRPVWIPGDLSTASHVYLRTDALRSYGELYSHRTPALTVLCLAPVTSTTYLMSTDDRTPSPSTVSNLQISLMRLCLSLTSWTICLFSLATLLVKHTLFLLLRRVLCLLLLCNCISFLSFHISRY